VASRRLRLLATSRRGSDAAARRGRRAARLQGRKRAEPDEEGEEEKKKASRRKPRDVRVRARAEDKAGAAAMSRRERGAATVLGRKKRME
jgi:hypothetical protein